ncbi:hypothetical protein RI129_006778 [Pyrocoelia pectoralis]|uniref:Uncharacterized protein n=1 Tax=Pyrocoelia pectoralis TaxID=417401 RepID=A0AAN7VET4_9COLE
MNCPQEHVKFEKIIGLRPSSDVHGYLLYKRKIYEPVALECLSKCSANVNCFSFVIFYNISECYWYDVDIRGSQETESVLDPNVVWFEKTCLDSDCNKLWIFERIPGTILIGYDVVTLPRKVTRNECQQNCLNYTNCRSARFRIGDDINLTNTLGTCVLSETDRSLVPNSFRAANYNEEYFENQCVEDKTDAFCAYEEYDHVILSQVDIKYDNFTKKQCEKLCDDITFFNCRGYSLIPSASVTQYLCLIHSTNSKVHGPRMLYSLSGANFFEKARCLNVTVTCTETYITVNYQPEVPFNGKVYMSGYSDNIRCYMIGNNTEEIVLKIPLLEDQCGITKAVTVHLNRTLLSGTMILQYNPVIQTQGDRLIKIGCIFNSDAKIVLGTGVNFANSSYLNQGTSIINTTTIQPTVEMRVIDFYTKKEVGATQVGQELQLVIELQPPDGAYDIWAAHLVAMSENGEDSILLLDDRGCATNPTIFPNLLKVYNNETRRLIANFNAFKFTSSSIIRFSITVQFCPTYCTLPNCISNNQDARPKIRREIQVLKADVKEVIKNQFDNENVTQMPLEFVLLVRNSKIVSNPLVYDENKKIIIAGYNLSTNEVCIDFSLTIGIIVTWIGIQIILLICGILMIKKYKNHYRHNSSQSLESLHKNFGLGFSNLGNRRVRWADSGSYT